MDVIEDECLTEADRRMDTCDGCGPAVKGRIYAAMPNGLELRYCFHHANKYRAGLNELGAFLYELSA